MAQSVKHSTLDFGLGHRLVVCEFELRVRLCPDGVEPAQGSPSLSAPPPPKEKKDVKGRRR